MQQLDLPRAAMTWPNACACCLRPATVGVEAQKIRIQDFVAMVHSESLTVTVPYCAECAPQVRKHSQQLSPGLEAALIFGLVFVMGACGSMCVVSFLAPALIKSLPVVIAFALPTLVTFLYVRAKQRKRELSAASPHFCAYEMPVSIHEFSRDRMVLQVENDNYAQAMRAMNAYRR